MFGITARVGFSKRSCLWLLSIALLSQTGCSVMPAAGPSARAVERIPQGQTGQVIRIVDVDDTVARGLNDSSHRGSLLDELGDGAPAGTILGKGDVLDVAIWEAPPSALFGSAGADARLASSSPTARGTNLPEQMIDAQGTIVVPFVGTVRAAGRTSQEIAQEIETRLRGKAHQPEAIVRLVRNAAANVTVVGDVTNNARVPLTPKGERLLDVLATVGGVRQPIGKMTIQITRGHDVASMPLEAIIKDPRQNIRMQADDVVTALFQPYSFTALGAFGRNEEVQFEGTGITLAQALGRVAGLQDQKANVKGVFVFRFEVNDKISSEQSIIAGMRPSDKIPTIYRFNLKDPKSFFVAQNFHILNKDVLYVSNAPLADIQKFVNVISSTILPVATATTIVQ